MQGLGLPTRLNVWLAGTHVDNTHVDHAAPATQNPPSLHSAQDFVKGPPMAASWRWLAATGLSATGRPTRTDREFPPSPSPLKCRTPVPEQFSYFGSLAARLAKTQRGLKLKGTLPHADQSPSTLRALEPCPARAPVQNAFEARSAALPRRPRRRGHGPRPVSRRPWAAAERGRLQAVDRQLRHLSLRLLPRDRDQGHLPVLRRRLRRCRGGPSVL
jgi:hypothetical protein